MDLETRLRELFRHNGDVVIKRMVSVGGQTAILVYSTGLIDTQHLQQVVLPQLNRGFAEGDLRPLPLNPISDDLNDWEKRLFEGEVLIFLENSLQFSWDVSNRPERSTEDANTEVSIKGPRDGFIENIHINVALIRKRLPSTKLACEKFVLGTISKTKVAMLYLADSTPLDVVEVVRNRLHECQNLKVVTSGILEKRLADNRYSLFPLIDYTGRPDKAIYMLLEKKVVILVDGSPVAMIGPVNLLEQIKSPEDDQYPVMYVWVERMLRLGGVWIAIFLPGFWVSLVAYNIEEFPFLLMATVAQGRKGMPFSAPMELFFILFIFEFLREAGARLPKTIGQTLALVGALIIGDASIRAGITSPSMLFVGALTVVASFTLVNQSLSGAVTVLRFKVFFLSAILGMYGFILSIMIIVYYVSTLTSFGRTYGLLSSSNIIATVIKSMFFALSNLLTQNRGKGSGIQ